MDNQQNKGTEQVYPNWLAQFLKTYQALQVNNLHLLNDVYANEVVFQDPMHQLNGINELQSYFENLYKNLQQCEFSIERVIYSEKQASVYWQMRYQHQKLNAGQQVVVQGNSLLKSDGNLVVYHRDYLDLGQMLYEQLPLLGRLIKWLKARAVQHG